MHYMERTYGETKMTKRFANEIPMWSLCLAAVFKLKFVS